MVSFFVLGALVLEVEAIQDPQTQGHDYSLISTRNAFNLSNEPPPRKESAPPPEPPKNLDLKFTGIFGLRGVEKACLAVTDTTAKPPETKYFQMPVGDKQGEIEITAIDAKTGLVKLLRNGALIELSLSNDEHTYKTAVAKAPTKSSSRSSSSRTSSRSSSSSRPTSAGHPAHLLRVRVARVLPRHRVVLQVAVGQYPVGVPIRLSRADAGRVYQPDPALLSSRIEIRNSGD